MPHTQRGGGHTPRGRPLRRITSNTGVPGVQPRVAWLLRANRTLGNGHEFQTMSSFAGAFQGGSYNAGISDSTVSRWETGSVRATFPTLRRYEELLGLPAGHLIAVADVIYRYAAPISTAAPALGRSEGALAGQPDDDRLDELLERALSDGAMSGWNWDELTAGLFALPRFFLPGRLWTELANRLVDETIVANGVGWLQRFEALSRLLGYPPAQRFAIGACASIVRDPDNQVFIEPTSVLDVASHPDAAAFVLEQLINPVNERARYGALLACVRKLRYGHFTEEQVDELFPVVLEILRDPDSHADAAPVAVELLRRFGEYTAPGVPAELRRALKKDRTLHEVGATGRLAPEATSSVIVDRIVATTAAALGNDAVFADSMLAQLLDDLLFAPVFDVRFNANILLRATPYRTPVAAAIAAELGRPNAVPEPALASCLLGSLRVLGGPDERPLVERLILAGGLPSSISVAAVRSVGHVGGVSTDGFWVNALSRYVQQWHDRGDPGSIEALIGLVYGLGISRHARLLALVRGDPSMPPPARAAARWWLSRPERLFTPAQPMPPGSGAVT